VLRDKQDPRNAAEIETEFGLPKPLAEEYAGITSFFSQLRDLRDAVVHGGTGVGRYTLQSKDSASIPSTGHSRPLMAGDPNTTTTRTSRPSCHGLQT